MCELRRLTQQVLDSANGALTLLSEDSPVKKDPWLTIVWTYLRDLFRA